MLDNLNFCEHCGAQLVQGANFCESCGKQVRKPQAAHPGPNRISLTPSAIPPQPTQPRPAPAPGYPAAPQTAKQPGKRSPVLAIVLGIGGCLGVLCILLVAVGAVLLARSSPTVESVTGIVMAESTQAIVPTEMPILEQPIPSSEAPLPAPTLADTPTPPPAALPKPTQAEDIEPTQAAAPSVSWPGDIGQEMSDSYFTDDFSSAAYDWADRQDDSRFFGIQDGHYVVHVREADYAIWAYLPTEFTPNTIGFDAAVLQGYEQGAYGVLCHYQDKENYHFVSIDPWNKEYSIGYVQNDEYETLMRDMWMPSFFLNDSPYAVNNIMISCDPDNITLFVNNELEAQASTGAVVGGDMAIYGETPQEAHANGFKVLFDNLFAYLQVQ